MDSEIIARPLMIITNVIWSSNTELHRPQLLLIKQADEPLKKHWVLPETFLRSKESADAACIRLIDDKIGLQVPVNSTEQLTVFTDPKRVTGTQALTFARVTYLPSTPRPCPGYGTIDAQWFVSDKDQDNHVITHDQQEITPSPTGYLVFGHIQIITIAIDRIKNRLDCQPRTLRILNNTFILRQAREVFAAFSGVTIDKIDNSNFKKTHNHLSKEVGAAILDHSERPPKFYQFN